MRDNLHRYCSLRGTRKQVNRGRVGINRAPSAHVITNGNRLKRSA
jgi:hypothetical protein